jgi:hypothetical protein
MPPFLFQKKFQKKFFKNIFLARCNSPQLAIIPSPAEPTPARLSIELML